MAARRYIKKKNPKDFPYKPIKNHISGMMHNQKLVGLV